MRSGSMAKPPSKEPKLADRQLRGINVEDAKRKWAEGLPVNLKEMAVALELGYSTVRNYSKMEGFPMLKGCVFPRLFDAWLQECFRQHVAVDPPVVSAERARPERTSNVRLPMQARQLLSDAGVRRP